MQKTEDGLIMKTYISTSLVLICLLVLAGCSKSPGSEPNYTRPEASGTDESPGSPSMIEDRLALESGLKKIVYHVGPVDLPSGLSVAEMIEKPLVMNFQTDEAVWVVGFSPRVVDSNGGELPPELLHLAIVSNRHEGNPLCSDAVGGSPFAAATSVLTEVNLPQGYGYPILATDPLEARVILKNETDESFVDVFFELTLLARPMGEMVNLRDVKPLFVELDPCDHETASVAPGEFVELGATYQVPFDSDLIVAHGILEDFGSVVELTAKEETTPFWRAEARLDENSRIVELSDDPFEDPAGIPFKEGDLITLGIAYDNTSRSWLNGATAAAMVYVAPRE